MAIYNPGNDLKELLRGSGTGLASINGENRLIYQHARKLCEHGPRREMGRKSRRRSQDEELAIEQIYVQSMSGITGRVIREGLYISVE